MMNQALRSVVEIELAEGEQEKGSPYAPVRASLRTPTGLRCRSWSKFNERCDLWRWHDGDHFTERMQLTEPDSGCFLNWYRYTYHWTAPIFQGQGTVTNP